MQPTPPVIHLLHSVPGRARFRVRGLRGSRQLQFVLTAELSRQKDIHRVYASPTTGNVLVHFEPDLDPAQIGRLIKMLVDHPKGDTTSENAADTDSEDLSPLSVHPDRRLKTPWHTLEAAGLKKMLQTDLETGLSDEAAKDRLSVAGPNVVATFQARPHWRVFFDQYKSLPVWLLAGEAAISVFSGNFLSAALLTGVLTASAAVGSVAELTSEKTILSAKSRPEPFARVLRNGREIDVPAEALVVGDVVLLEPGSYIAADCRILEAFELRIDQSALTGESRTVSKQAWPLDNKKIPLIGRFNMAYRGTLVMGGRGRAVVVATGRHTVYGRLQNLLKHIAQPEPPIDRQLRTLGDRMVYLAGGLCALTGIISLVRGWPAGRMLRSLLALAAAAFPSGLLPAATVNFAVGTGRNRRRQVSIRRLQALQTLAAVDTVCFDKTGTITRDRINVLQVHAGYDTIELRDRRFVAGGKPIDPLTRAELRYLLKICILCNEARIEGNGEANRLVLKGSPTEKALLHMGILSGIDVPKVYADYPLLKVEHRTETRRFMITVHKTGDGRQLKAVKGDPTEVLQLCSHHYRKGKRIALNKASIQRIELSNEAMSSRGLRVMGFAWTHIDPADKGEEEFSWLGLVGMAEPIRQGAKALMASLHGAGIDTLMITGDQNLTAQTVARIIGISGDKPLDILDSAQFDSVSPELLQALTTKASVYTRVNPEQKLRIVQALQSSGKTVAMTGDGINDGPAMKAADIGIAMGLGGTDTARDVADVVLNKDNLSMLGPTIETGRTTFENIRKSLRYTLTTSFSDTMLTLAGAMGPVGYPLILHQPSQINLVADILPGLALALEPAEYDVMEKKPSDFQRSILNRADQSHMAREASAIGCGALAAYGFGLMRYGAGHRASTMAHQSLFLGKLLHAVACRSERHSFFHQTPYPANPYLKIALAGSVLLQGLTLLVPGLRQAAGLARLNLPDMVLAGVTAVIPHVVNEVMEARIAAGQLPTDSR